METKMEVWYTDMHKYVCMYAYVCVCTCGSSSKSNFKLLNELKMLKLPKGFLTQISKSQCNLSYDKASLAFFFSFLCFVVWALNAIR